MDLVSEINVKKYNSLTMLGHTFLANNSLNNFSYIRHRMKNGTCNSVICICCSRRDKRSPHSADFLEKIIYFVHVLATLSNIYSKVK